MSEHIVGVKCPLCTNETMHKIKHTYGGISFGLKWYHCDTCDKDLCRDQLAKEWKIASYDIELPEQEDTDE